MAKELNKDNFESEVYKEGVSVVDFWAEWCGPCQEMLPTLEEFSGEIEDKARVYKVNVDSNPELAQQFRVMSIPTIIFFKDGKPVEQRIGVQSKKELTDTVNNI